MTLPRRYTVPDVPIGHVQNPFGPGAFSIIVPIQRTNLITNPSFETATTNWTASGGSIARSTTYSYHGAYSLAVTPTATTTDGAYFGTVSLTSGTTYAFSCKFYDPVAGSTYKISIATTGGSDLAAYRFKSTGRWQWVYGYYTETSSTSRRLYITKNGGTQTRVFYIDGAQVEAINAGETVSTYIDGDQAPLLPNQFPAPFYWTGTPHASTSVRLATTRAGGYLVNLDRFRYRVIAWAGLGLTTIANIISVPANADGAAYQATLARSRQFVINGEFAASRGVTLDQMRSDLYSIVGPDSAQPRQPLVIHYQRYDDQTPISEMGRIVASYQSGLEGLDNSPFKESAPITFTTYLPSIQGGDQGTSLTVQSTVANANAIVQRAADGTWSAMSTGMTGGSTTVYALVQGLDGTLYAGGSFTDAGGSGADYLAQWNGSSWAVVKSATSINTDVFALARGPDGKIYIGGNFTNADGIAAADYIVAYDPSAGTFAALGTGGNAQVTSLAFAPDGTLYAGGNFTLMGGVANTAYIAKWNGSAWSALSTGMDSTVNDIAIAPDGTLYACGTFSNAGGTSAVKIAKWNGSAWSALGSGITGGSATPYTLLAAPNGMLYVGGDFTTAGGVSSSYFAQWNGAGWSKPAGGSLNNLLRKIFRAPDGTLYLSGTFTSAGGITLSDSITRWNGSSFAPAEFDLPGTATIFTMLLAPTTNILYVGYTTNGSATTAGITSTAVGGTARTYPTFIISGPSSGSARIYQIQNVTNGKLLYLNYTISAGETAYLRTSPTGATMWSTFSGDVTSAILPGSSSDFALEPGTNSISFFTASSSVTARIIWAKSAQALPDLTN